MNVLHILILGTVQLGSITPYSQLSKWRLAVQGVNLLFLRLVGEFSGKDLKLGIVMMIWNNVGYDVV